MPREYYFPNLPKTDFGFLANAWEIWRIGVTSVYRLAGRVDTQNNNYFFKRNINR